MKRWSIAFLSLALAGCVTVPNGILPHYTVRDLVDIANGGWPELYDEGPEYLPRGWVEVEGVANVFTENDEWQLSMRICRDLERPTHARQLFVKTRHSDRNSTFFEQQTGTFSTMHVRIIGRITNTGYPCNRGNDPIFGNSGVGTGACIGPIVDAEIIEYGPSRCTNGLE